MSRKVTPGFELVGVYYDAATSQLPISVSVNERALNREVTALVAERRSELGAAAIQTGTISTTVRFAGNIKGAGGDCYGETRTKDGKAVIELNAPLLHWEDGLGVEDEDLETRLSVVGAHEASHLADDIAMGEQATYDETIRHEYGYTRKFRAMAIMGVLGVAATGVTVLDSARRAVQDIIEMPVATGMFVAGALIGGLAVVCNLVGRGVHSVIRHRSEKCYETRPSEIRARRAEARYRMALNDSNAEPIVIVKPKTA